MTMCSYGYFGDLMTHSESLRWLGRYRYDISPVEPLLEDPSQSSDQEIAGEDEPDEDALSPPPIEQDPEDEDQDPRDES